MVGRMEGTGLLLTDGVVATDRPSLYPSRLLVSNRQALRS